MALTAQGATFTFANQKFSLLSIRVERPSPEVANMTGKDDRAGYAVMVPTGDILSPGSITVEAISAVSVRQGETGQLSFMSSGLNYSAQVIVASVSIDARVGDLIRSTMSFTPTDYYGP